MTAGKTREWVVRRRRCPTHNGMTPINTAVRLRAIKARTTPIRRAQGYSGR